MVKKSPQKPLKSKIKLIKMLCEGCGAVVEIPEGSEGWCCGQKLVKWGKWRVRK